MAAMAKSVGIKPLSVAYKPLPWGSIRHPPDGLGLSEFEIESKYEPPKLLTKEEFSEVIAKAERLCCVPDPTCSSQLVVILWAKRCLDKRYLFWLEPRKLWVLSIKRAARVALQMMRDAGEQPAYYFPNKIEEYERAFAD